MFDDAVQVHFYMERSDVEKLNEIDTSTIEPIIHMTGEKNRVRKDEDSQNLPVIEAIKNAKVKSDNYFVVPKVIKKENG